MIYNDLQYFCTKKMFSCTLVPFLTGQPRGQGTPNNSRTRPWSSALMDESCCPKQFQVVAVKSLARPCWIYGDVGLDML